MSGSHGGWSSPALGGPPPIPPPKPHSQDPSRTATPATQFDPHHQNQNQNQQQRDYSRQPPLPVPPLQTQSPPGPLQTHLQGTTPSFQYRQPADQSYGQDQGGNPIQTQQSHSQPPPMIFELPDSITKQTTADLSKLLSDPDLLTALAQLHPTYAAALQPLQNQISANLNMASQIAALETQAKHLREQTGQLLLQHTSLQTQWRRKQTEMDQALAPWGPRAMYQRLVSGINEQEAMLMAVQESFLEGPGDDRDNYGGSNVKATEKEVTDWIRRLREGTTVLEKRREMRARWDEGRVGGWR